MTDFIAGLIFAFVGSLHCIGMCGPIALALSGPDTGRAHYVVGRLFYNGGRTVTYVLLGVLAGSIGKTIALVGVQQILSIVLGGMIILFGVFPFLQSQLLPKLPGFGNLTHKLSQMLGRVLGQRSIPGLILIGILNGLLPCGFVYFALAASVTTGEVFRAAVFMGGFGLGTIPAMLVVSLLGKQVGIGIRERLRVMVPVVTVLIGVLLVLRGLNLGIPYVSPRVEKTPQVEEVRCH